MKLDLAPLTPYLMFIFGCVITYIGYTTKKILENIEHSVSKTADKVESHAIEISGIHATLAGHNVEISNIKSNIDGIKKSVKL